MGGARADAGGYLPDSRLDPTAVGTVLDVKDTNNTYSKVLQYATAVTGVPAEVIEALSFKYAQTKPALLDAGGGAQRPWNGYGWVWQCIALSAMTGNIDKSGGGIGGISMGNCADQLTMSLAHNRNSNVINAMVDILGENNISTNLSEHAHLILTGKDRRSRQRFIDDVKLTTNGAVDLSTVPAGKKMVEVDVIYTSSSANGNKVNTAENINKNIEAYKRAKFILGELSMTASALYADIIFPVASQYEYENVNFSVSMTALHACQKIIDPMYETKTDAQIHKAVFTKVEEKLGFGNDLSAMYNNMPMSTLINFYATSNVFKNVTGRNYEYSLDDLLKEGISDAYVPIDKPIVSMRDVEFCKNGQLETTTGLVNFYSPLWDKVRPHSVSDLTDPTAVDAAGYTAAKGGKQIDGLVEVTAKYVPQHEGIEKFFEGNNPRTGAFKGYDSPISGRNYKLTYMTNKARNRAHTNFDNVALLKNEFPQVAKMNPTTAAERGIKNNDMVYVYNDRGCMKIPAFVTPQLPPGVISIEHGAWYRAHPTETVKVWMQTEMDEQYKEARVPVDVGGADNILTLDIGSAEASLSLAVNCSGGPCEVSLTKPE